jgi:hypothetical protein
MRKVKISAELTPAEEGGYIIYCPELDVHARDLKFASPLRLERITAGTGRI